MKIILKVITIIVLLLDNTNCKAQEILTFEGAWKFSNITESNIKDTSLISELNKTYENLTITFESKNRYTFFFEEKEIGNYIYNESKKEISFKSDTNKEYNLKMIQNSETSITLFLTEKIGILLKKYNPK